MKSSLRIPEGLTKHERSKFIKERMERAIASCDKVGHLRPKLKRTYDNTEKNKERRA